MLFCMTAFAYCMPVLRCSIFFVFGVFIAYKYYRERYYRDKRAYVTSLTGNTSLY